MLPLSSFLLSKFRIRWKVLYIKKVLLLKLHLKITPLNNEMNLSQILVKSHLDFSRIISVVDGRYFFKRLWSR